MNPKCMKLEHLSLRYPPSFYGLASTAVISLPTGILKPLLCEPRVLLTSSWRSLTLPPDGTAPLQKPRLRPWVSDGIEEQHRGALEKREAGEAEQELYRASRAVLSRIFAP